MPNVSVGGQSDASQTGRLQRAMGQLQKMIEEGRSFSGNERNCCFLNTGAGHFATVSAVSGLDFPDDARAVVPVDWDHDGDLDLWISNRNAPRLRLMRNETSQSGRSLSVKLIGNGKTTSRDAIGARVEVLVGSESEKKNVRTLRAGEGFLSQSSKWVHFGLGKETKVQSVQVSWPGGEMEEFAGCAPGGRFVLTQGQGTAKQDSKRTAELTLQPKEQEPAASCGSLRIPLVSLLPMPTGRSKRCLTFDDKEKPINYGAGKSTLLVFFGSWCEPCRAELKELKGRYKDLKQANINVVPLAVDGIDDDSSPGKAKQYIEHLQAPFEVFRARPEFAQLMTGYHHMLVALKQPLPIPVSFLVDEDGNLSVIYKGAVDIDQVIHDASKPPTTLKERWIRSACLHGRSLDDDGVYASLRRREANVLAAMGNWFRQREEPNDAKTYFRQAIELEPKFAKAHQDLAVLLEKTGDETTAAEHYQKVIAASPEDPVPYFNLGNIYSRHSRYDDSRRCYRAALKLNPKYKEAHMNLGVVLMAIKKPRKAEIEFRAVLGLDPKFRPAQEWLARAERAKGGD